MPRVVGVTFRSGPKVYAFLAGDLPIERGSRIVAETSRGLEIGRVTVPPGDVPETRFPTPLKPIHRAATAADLLREDRLREKEERAGEECAARIRERRLPMKLVGVHLAFDESMVTFYFTAEGRVDFRDLLKDLNSVFRTRIHLFQIGARDAARLAGGMGPCGRDLCCARWLSTFDPISIRMAKDQSLFLNPEKFSGACGKLMCCLRYEYDTYAGSREDRPAVEERESADGPDPGDGTAGSPETDFPPKPIQERPPACPCHGCGGKGECPARSDDGVIGTGVRSCD